jgi:hypothetical protein
VISLETIFIFIAIAVGFLYILSIDWRKLIISVLVLIIIEGVLRKWVLPQASDAIYFLKDLLLFAAYISYYFKSKYHQIIINKKFNEVFTQIIYFLFGICLIQAFNPSLGSVFVGFFGIKNYLFYIPLVWMLPNLFNSKEELYKFLRFYLLLTIPVCILAIAQFFSPPDSPINVYAAGSIEGIATFGVGGDDGAVRVTGSFPYISGLGFYLSVSLILIIPLLSTKQSLKWHIISIIETLLVIVSSFMTGSRAVVFFAGIYLFGYLTILFFNKKQLFNISFKRFIVPTIVIVLSTVLFFSKSVDLFTQRTVSNQEEGYTRVLTPLIEPWLLPLRLDGYGTGASHQATPKVREVLGVDLATVELPPPNDGSSVKVMLDLGPIGLILWEGLRLYLLLVLWNTFKRLQDPLLIQLALSILLFSIIQFTAPLVSNPVLSLYYWFFIGFIFLLPRLDSMKEVVERIPNE